MSSPISDLGLKDAIVRSVELGAYPDSEDVSSAELNSSVLPALLSDLERARDDVKADIRHLSKEVAPDVDGWIAQAKQLQADIEHSKNTAREIVRQAEEGARLRAEADEAASKARLLEKEVIFNSTLVSTLEHIKIVRRILDESQNAMIQEDLVSALAKLKEVDLMTPELVAVENTRAYDIIQKRTQDLKAALAEQAAIKVRGLIDVNVPSRRLTIPANGSDSDRSSNEIEATIDTLSFLGARQTFMKRLRRELDSAILQPRFAAQEGKPQAIHICRNVISVEDSSDTNVLSVLDDVWSILEFLHSHLPSNVCSPLFEMLVPQLIDDVTTTWLDPCVPVEISQMPYFQEVLDRVARLEDQIDSLKLPAQTSALRDWVQSAPKTWLAKRRETSLGVVRSLLFTKLKERKIVERIETQIVSKGDALMGDAGDAGDDAWDAAWEEDEGSKYPITRKSANESRMSEDDDEDASAWDVDEDQSQETSGSTKGVTKKSIPDDDADADVDAWGWGDEEPAAQDELQSKKEGKGRAAPDRKEAATEREITLRETYTSTAVPDGILETVKQCVADAETLTNPSYAHTPIGPAASALYTLPTFALAMYRATAATAYGRLDSGNMLIYNDSSHLADQLRSYIVQQAEKDNSSDLAVQQRPSSRLKLETDIKALDTFARRSYSTEMESQRTILNDMLDGAQGFVNCTVEPYASACESAIDITASRLRDVHGQWLSILSRSALLQSLGSLLSTVTSKLIIDIQDMSDIGDEESKKLRSFCDRLSEVKELFIQEHPDDGKPGDMTGIYCPNWFKFQYLAEILESSLADIKFLWIEGELRLEFDAEEVIDLVQALFADSDYRRKAIAEIRRSSR